MFKTQALNTAAGGLLNSAARVELSNSDRRRASHQKLDQLFDALEDYNINGLPSEFSAFFHVLEVARFASTICGDQVLGEICFPGKYTELSRSENLAKLALRMFLAKSLFGGHDNVTDPASIENAVLETLSIKGGDKPQMFAKLAGATFKVSIYRAKSRALIWEAYIQAANDETPIRRGDIEAAFRERWDTIRSWKTGCEKAVGINAFATLLQQAKRAGKLMGSLPPELRNICLFKGYETQSWEKALVADGETYRRSLQFRKNAGVERR